MILFVVTVPNTILDQRGLFGSEREMNRLFGEPRRESETSDFWKANNKLALVANNIQIFLS